MLRRVIVIALLIGMFAVITVFGYTKPNIPEQIAEVKVSYPPLITITVGEPEVNIVTVAATQEEVTEAEVVEPRYGFTEDDIYLLAQLLCGDASIDGDGEYDFVWGTIYRETNWEEISKILCVVMNRVRSDKFPDTVSEVVMAKGQFEVMPANAETSPHDIAIKIVKEWCDAYDNWDTGIQNVPENHLYFRAGPNLTTITREEW